MNFYRLIRLRLFLRSLQSRWKRRRHPAMSFAIGNARRRPPNFRVYEGQTDVGETSRNVDIDIQSNEIDDPKNEDAAVGITCHGIRDVIIMIEILSAPSYSTAVFKRACRSVIIGTKLKFDPDLCTNRIMKLSNVCGLRFTTPTSIVNDRTYDTTQDGPKLHAHERCVSSENMQEQFFMMFTM